MQSRCISNIPRIAVAVAVSLMLALMPFSVNLNQYRISLERQQAHAIAPVFAGAAAFLAEAATAAGFASTGEMVATIVGMTAVGSGMMLANDAGVRYGTEASQNLNNLIDAADYPAWDTLSSTEQSNWGSKENYDSAKFNSLMAAYGLGGAYDRYQSAWGSGGAGNFSFSSQEQSSLEQIGQIGSNWASGVPNVVSDILSLFDNNANQVITQYIGPTNYEIFDGSNISNWPLSFKDVKVNRGTQFLLQYDTNKYWSAKSSQDVYYLIAWYPNSTQNGRIWVQLFSKSPFTFGVSANNNPTLNLTAGEHTYNGQVYYSGSGGQAINATTINNQNMVDNGILSYSDWNNIDKVCQYILFGDTENVGSPEVPEYPGVNNIQPNVEIYFPETGLHDETPWSELLESSQNIENDVGLLTELVQHIDNDLHDLKSKCDNVLGNQSSISTVLQHIDSDLHKFNFYNDGNLKVHDEGVFTELSDIYALLMEINGKLGNWGDISDAPDLIGDFDFDELENKVPDLLETISDLAPFGSILLLSEMYSIMANYTKIQSPELVFPFDFGGFDDQNHELVIDLSWLDDIRPLINFFCIALLIIAIANATIRIVEIEAAS